MTASLHASARAVTLSGHLAAYLTEHLASRVTLTLGGEHYDAVPAEDYGALGYPVDEPDLMLLRCTGDGAVFEVWVTAGALPAHRPVAGVSAP